MKFLGPTPFRRLNEALGIVFLLAGLLLALSLASYHPLDPSWDTVSSALRPQNLIGRAGAFAADLCFQFLGLAAAALPFLAWVLAWKWVRSEKIDAPLVRLFGSLLLVGSVCTALSLAVSWQPWSGAISCGGVLGVLLADWLTSSVNATGALLITAACFVLSLYLISTFSVFSLQRWFAAPLRVLAAWRSQWQSWRQRRKEIAAEKAEARRALRAEERAEKLAARQRRRGVVIEETPAPVPPVSPAPVADTPPWEEPPVEDIPIHVLEDEAPAPEPPIPAPIAVAPAPAARARKPEPSAPLHPEAYRLPPTSLLNEAPGRSAHDTAELKEIAARIKSKFEEFNVLGSVVQINPGPVVTTFEFKPEAGVKYSKITSLTEDLCLGLQAESILIERIPGKPTVGIEVPNNRREVISLRQILESEEFDASPSHLTLCLGKDISGRIKVASLESMPHLLIAGSTGAGKSVMLNSMIMSILYKATPDEVRLIMVDPKREIGRAHV